MTGAADGSGSGTGSAQPVGPSGGDATAAHALRQVTGLVLGQLTALTALAFYFGWARTNAFLEYFGINPTVVGLGTTDYVLRSISAGYWPLMLIAGVVVVALAVHRLVRRAFRPMPVHRQRRWLSGVAGLGVLLLAVTAACVLGLFGSTPALLVPLLMTGGFALLAYGLSAWPRRGEAPELLARAQFVALAGLMAGGIFWAWGQYAAQGGLAAARHLEDRLAYQTDVTVFSSQRLGLAGTGIRFDAIGDETSAYHFRYTGLRLLIHSGDRYFLLPKGWERGQDPVIVLAESGGVRLQFVVRAGR